MADQVPDGTGDSLKLGHRVSVVGATGSGKTTTGKRLANILGVPFVELDALQWEANWTVAQDDIFRERIESAISGDRWVVDGNYSRIQPIVWRRADRYGHMDRLLVANNFPSTLEENTSPADNARGTLGW